MKLISLAARILISIFFVASAVGKLTSIDAFDVFVFRTSFLGYDAATIAARLLIGIELLIALFLLIRLKVRFIWWITLLFLLIFSGFLAVQAVGGSEDNCFCMGELVEFSPIESLIKNVVLIILLFVIRKTRNLKFRGENWVFAVVSILGVAAPMIASPPDVFVSGRFNAAEHDQNALDRALDEGEIPQSFVTGKKLLSFYSTGCRFCKMAATRIGTVAEKADIDTAKMKVVFWGGDSLQADGFYEETHSPELDYSTLATEAYLGITKGRMPLILLVEDGEVKHQMNYRTLDENLIKDFFGTPD